MNEMNALESCVANFRGNPHGELELRLGSFADGRFAPGVPREVFETLEADMQLLELEADPGWTELVDYHYTTGRHQHMRTRVTFDTARIELAREHVAKRACESAVLCRDGSTEACRVAVSDEPPVAEVPPVCMPTLVRIKQRRCFQDVREGSVVWSYELSKTWSASSRSAAEHLQHHQEPVFEVECELVDAGRKYLAQRDDAQVAASLLLKAKGLLGEESTAELECAREGHKRARHQT